MATISMDCRSEEGITVGLIDGILAAVRVLRERDLTKPGVVEALKDLVHDRDLAKVLAVGARAWKK